MLATEQRLNSVQTSIRTEEANLVAYADSKDSTESELKEAEAAITELQNDLKALNEELEERNKAVEQVKKVASKSAKALDQVLKDISAKVRGRLG